MDRVEIVQRLIGVETEIEKDAVVAPILKGVAGMAGKALKWGTTKKVLVGGKKVSRLSPMKALGTGFLGMEGVGVAQRGMQAARKPKYRHYNPSVYGGKRVPWT